MAKIRDEKGQFVKGHIVSEEWKQKFIKALKGKQSWNKGIKGKEYRKHYPNGIKGGRQKGYKYLEKSKIKMIKNHHSKKEGYISPLKNRKRPEFIGRFSGEKNPMYGKSKELCPAWRGGLSFEPYGLEFDDRLREQIRKRDDFVCQECEKTQKELKRLLGIHHIDYNKQNNSTFNLISLCPKCHMKTNFNRKHWTAYFKMKIFLKEFFNPQNIKVFENKQLIMMERI